MTKLGLLLLLLLSVHHTILLLLPNHTATFSFQSPKVVQAFLCTHFLYIFIFSFTHAALPLMSGSSTPGPELPLSSSSTPVTGAAVEQFFLMW